MSDFAWMVVSAGIPAGAYWIFENNKERQRQHWIKQGHKVLNEVFLDRKKRSRKLGAYAYAGTFTFLELARHGLGFGVVAPMFGNLFITLISCPAFTITERWSFKAIDYFKVNSVESVNYRATAMAKVPEPLKPRNEHGESKLEFPEDTELASPKHSIGPSPRPGEL